MAWASWTQNWPYEPLVGNTPTSSTFIWTWISFCFTFFAFGAVPLVLRRPTAFIEIADGNGCVDDFERVKPAVRLS